MRAGTSSGCRRQGRSCRQALLFHRVSPTCRAGRGTKCSIPTGCAWGPT
jgi:hypothetical protein